MGSARVDGSVCLFAPTGMLACDVSSDAHVPCLVQSSLGRAHELCGPSRPVPPQGSGLAVSGGAQKTSDCIREPAFAPSHFSLVRLFCRDLLHDVCDVRSSTVFCPRRALVYDITNAAGRPAGHPLVYDAKYNAGYLREESGSSLRAGISGAIAMLVPRLVGPVSRERDKSGFELVRADGHGITCPVRHGRTSATKIRNGMRSVSFLLNTWCFN